MAAQRVDGQAIAEGFTQETEVAGAEDDVVGVVHHSNVRAVVQVVLEGIQAHLVNQLQTRYPDLLVELTLTNRDSMGYRMLLGREAMVDRILVDPAAGRVVIDPIPGLLEDVPDAD